jgi:hypothetical protein
MTLQECLADELEYLQELLSFFEKIKYEVMSHNVKKRITIVEQKISQLSYISEPVY